MAQNLPTSGQLERNLSQSIQKLYRQELEHSPSKVTCQLFGNQLAIVIEDALTAVEKTLANTEEDSKTVKQLNGAINEAIESKLKTLIEEILAVDVHDILFDSTLKTNRTGAIVTLAQPPQVRNPESIPKNKNGKSNK
ncbi:conserved hypothetical protein [Hyella patelloides LEGE 07179]|uniref:Na+-translocating membrane potential-generating system MpsC domain-containing protein n=1 Tax=Hyella patelloides LEGE 07179 TaxID=945734 RepID=A0A563VRI8_9CYAN|nr:DUF2294 domain-containing protein [Hyella patelloides]VEP13887.1 conserved hypothetical protein [Hyella patelloides LEGE 07179]